MKNIEAINNETIKKILAKKKIPKFSAGDTIKIPRIPRPTRKPKRMSRGGSVGGSSTSGGNAKPKGWGAARWNGKA